jgi:hypothetical protein
LVFKAEGKRAGDDGRKEAYREAAREMMDAIAGLREQQKAVLKQG